MAIFLGLGCGGVRARADRLVVDGVPLLVAGTLCFMALGLFAGAVARTTEGAVNMANFLVLPMAFLSGSFFPLDAAPPWLQTFSLVLPLDTSTRACSTCSCGARGRRRCSCRWPILPASPTALTLLAARLFRWETR